METVNIVGVEGPNTYGWFTVELSDGREAGTKDKKVAELAAQFAGQAVGADITVKPSKDGDFENVYINKVEPQLGVNDGDTPTAPTPTAIKPSQADRKQADIAAQWAVGRAVEALVGGTLDELLDTDTVQKLTLAATNLLALRDQIASQ